MRTSGVELCARFSLATNRLRYCGPGDAEDVLLRTIAEGTDLEATRANLERFEALEPYLRVLGDVHGLDPFDHDVVEAYWIGNELLDEVPRRAYLDVLKALRRNGLPPSVAARLAVHLPERAPLHHTFHVAYVGVGAVTGKVPTTLENMDRCRPSWGRVAHLEDGALSLERAPLVSNHGRLALAPPVEVSYAYDTRLLPGLARGDWVAVHWDTPVARLDPSQVRRLEAYTTKSLEPASIGLRSLGVF